MVNVLPSCRRARSTVPSGSLANAMNEPDDQTGGVDSVFLRRSCAWRTASKESEASATPATAADDTALYGASEFIVVCCCER
jgi:hypothetical protein